MSQESQTQEPTKLAIFDFSRTICGNEGVYDGLVDQVKTLRENGWQVAIASLAPLQEMKDEMQRIPAEPGKSMYDLFHPIIGQEALKAINAGKADKTSRETAREIILATGASRSHTVVVGDAFTELLLAKNNGLKYLHAGWDDRNKDGLRCVCFEGSDVDISEVDVEVAQSIPCVSQISDRLEAVLEPQLEKDNDPELDR